MEASKWMEEARILDTADRFVNCKCVKYLFRVNQVERAIEVAGLFTRVSESVVWCLLVRWTCWLVTADCSNLAK